MRKIKLTFLLGMFLASLPAMAQTEEDAKNAALDFLKQKKGMPSWNCLHRNLM